MKKGLKVCLIVIGVALALFVIYLLSLFGILAFGAATMGESEKNLSYYEEQVENVLKQDKIEYTKIASYDFDSQYQYDSIYQFTNNGKEYIVGLDGDKTGVYTHFIVAVSDHVTGARYEGIDYDLLCRLAKSVSKRHISKRRIQKVAENRFNYYNGDEHDYLYSEYAVEHTDSIDFYEGVFVSFHIDNNNQRYLAIEGEGK